MHDTHNMYQGDNVPVLERGGMEMSAHRGLMYVPV